MQGIGEIQAVRRAVERLPPGWGGLPATRGAIRQRHDRVCLSRKVHSLTVSACGTGSSNLLIWRKAIRGQQRQPIDPEYLPRNVPDDLDGVRIRFLDSGLNAQLAPIIIFPRNQGQPVTFDVHIIAVVARPTGFGVLIEPLKRDGIVLSVYRYGLGLRHGG